jgi:hypothetical protein
VKILALCVLLCASFLEVGCNSMNNNTPTTPPVVDDSATVYYQVSFFGFHPLRDSEFYILWLKIAPDSVLRMASVLQINPASPIDSAIMFGKFEMVNPLDSIEEALITLEKTSTPQTAGLPIARSGKFNADSSGKHLSSVMDASQFLGDYTALSGSLVFTSTLPDTLAYTHEFYLMNEQGVKQSSSLLSLSLPPAGWKYGLWAEDLHFTPNEFFFYGLFSSPEGHDSDSTNDHYPYPGGWKPQAMNVPSGSIIVTLEPLFYGDNLKLKGASPFTLLQFNRIRYIERDHNYPMSNISHGNIPLGGTIAFRKN